MEHLRNDWSEFLDYAKDFIDEPFVMLDIGCSGGINKIFKNFGEKIIYYGFDFVEDEIKRLNKSNNQNNFNYIEAYIDCGKRDKSKNYKGKLTPSFPKTSAAEAQKIVFKGKESFNELMEANLYTDFKKSKNTINISEFLLKNNVDYVDFLKSDIDGYDLDFIKTIKSNLISSQILALIVEVGFADDYNDESDMTNLLKQYGFGLNLLSTRQYTSKFLPDLFEITIPAQTSSGRIIQGDALYIKDFAYYKRFSAQKLLKLSIILDLFNLTDQAAQIFNEYGSEIKETGIDVKKSLNLMVKQRKFIEGISYKEFINEFHKNHYLFYLHNQAKSKNNPIPKKKDNKFYLYAKNLIRKIKLFKK